MDASLSDLLICPRCGPTYGLILLPYDAAERRVRAGVLGCANCRGRYPIQDGVADLRSDAVEAGPAPTGASGAVDQRRSSDDPAVRLAGLLDLAEAQGTVLLAGRAAAHASALAGLVPGVQVVTTGGGDIPGTAGLGISVMRLGNVLPFRSRSLRGVALTGPFATLVEEGARVLGRRGHLVLDPAPAGAVDRLGRAGMTVLAEEGPVVVAGRAA